MLNSIGLILAIAVIVATLTISQAMQKQIGEEVEKYGPNIVVKPETRSVTVPYGNIMMGRSTLPESYLALLTEIPNAKNIRIVSPKLFGQAQVEEANVLVVGLIPDHERYLKAWWDVKGELPREDTNEVLLGSEIMDTLSLSLGSTVTINGQPFTVTASLSETGSNDDYVVFMHLHKAQQLLGLMGEISLIDIGALCSDCPVEAISEQIMEVIPDVRVSPIKQAVETRMKAVEQAVDFSLTLASVVLVAGCVGVMNTMISSVHQRRGEIGVLMSLGADDNYVYRIFVFESLILGAVGGLFGVVLGGFSSTVLGPLVLSTQISMLDIPVFSLPLSLGISVVASILACLYPTWRAIKTDPVAALKAI